MIDKIQLAKEMAKDGFGLEVRAAEVFKTIKDPQFKAQQRFLIPGAPSIDVVASSFSSIFVGECKGYKANACLALRGNTNERINEKKVTFGNAICAPLNKLTYHRGNGLVYSEPHLAVEKGALIGAQGGSPIMMQHCYSGDFREGHLDQYRLTARNDANNNLYKGATQLVAAINNMMAHGSFDALMDSRSEAIDVLPLLITNCDIHILENHDQAEAPPVEWTIYDCRDLVMPDGHVQVTLTHIFIVNINHLDRFAKLFG